MLLDDFGLDASEKRALLGGDPRASAGRGDGARGAGEKNRARHLGDRYRAERKVIEGVLDRANDGASELRLGLAALDARSLAIGEAARAIRARVDADLTTRRARELLLSFTHMHVNRCLSSDQSQHEGVIYEFLVRYYDAQRARAKQGAAREPLAGALA